MEFGIYIHIPFCERICPYCDFNAYATNIIPEEDYCSAVLRQLDAEYEQFHSHELVSIYFGGGTPSLFTAKSLERILKAIFLKWDNGSTEITIEINPEHLQENYIKELALLGISRISLGLQSLQKSRLHFLGRKHSPEMALDGIELLNKYHLNNYNLDLIFGLPNETLEDIEKDLNQYLNLNPKHISCYQLTIESGTAFSIKYPNKKVVPDDYSADCYNKIIETLNAKKLFQYEISNFAVENFESRHNMLYWTSKPYLGLGAGAHSFNRNGETTRWQTIRNFKEYIKDSTKKNLLEILTEREFQFDFLFTNLRKIRGFSRKEFYNNFLIEAIEVFPKIQELSEMNLIEINSDIKLTRQGIFLYDSIMEKLSEES